MDPSVPSSLSTSDETRELNSLLDQAVERLSAREREVAELQSQVQGERRRVEGLETQLHVKEREVMDLLRQKGQLEQRVREAEDKWDQDHRALKRVNTDLTAQTETLQGRLREFEQQRAELEKTKLKFDQALALQAESFTDQVKQDRNLIAGMYDISQKFFQEMHHTAQSHHQELVRLQEGLNRHQTDLQKTQMEFQGRSELLLKNSEALREWLAGRFKAAEDQVGGVEGQVGRQVEAIRSVEQVVDRVVTEAWGRLQQGLEDLGGQLRESHEILRELHQERLQKSIQPMMAGEEFYSDMMFGISHQLKNPLGVIRANAQLCLKGLGKKGREGRLLEAIIQSCDHMQARLVEFVELTKPVQYTLSPGLIPALLDESFALVQVRAEEQKIIVEKTYEETPLLSLDGEKFKQALLHVLVNALDAMPQGGHLRLVVQQEGEMTVVRIQDTGVGIPAENLEKVWQPFFSTKEGHLGLGLVPLWRWVVAHRGTVGIQSAEGQGATLVVRLPFQKGETA